jgi:hypothetical protein
MVANDADRGRPPGIFSVHGVRYQVTDVARAAAFYGESQQPGGWNRVVLRVADLPAQIDALKSCRPAPSSC